MSPLGENIAVEINAYENGHDALRISSEINLSSTITSWFKLNKFDQVDVRIFNKYNRHDTGFYTATNSNLSNIEDVKIIVYGYYERESDPDSFRLDRIEIRPLRTNEFIE